MTRGTQHVLLLLVGLSTGLIVVKGTYLNYVKPSLRWWLLTAAVVLIALSVVAIARDLRKGVRDGDHTDGAHSHRTGLLWLLLVPVVMTAFVAPPPVGPAGASPQAVSMSEPQRRPFPPLPPGPAPSVSLPDLLMRAAADSTDSLKDRTVSVTGFTMSSGDRTDLARVVIVCCAADAQLARIHLSGNISQYPEDTWLRVEGRVLPGTSMATTNFVATLAVSSTTLIDKPANTYAY